jgi:hypothetical protein
MVEYLPRSAWTSTAAGGATLTGSKLLGTSVHYPGDGNVIYAGLTRDQVAGKLRAYRSYHVNTRGWSDIGYQVAGDQAGRVWDLRGIGRVPAASASDANPDANQEWGAFLMVIGNSEAPSPALIEAFRHWRFHRWLTRWVGKTAVRGHRQVPGAQTSCPGSRVVALIDNGTLLQRPGTAPAPTPTPEDEMELTDRVALQPSDANVKYTTTATTVAGILASTNYYTLWARNLGLQNAATIKAMGTRLEALFASTRAEINALAARVDIDPAELAAIRAEAQAGAEAAMEALIDEARVELVVDDVTPPA